MRDLRVGNGIAACIMNYYEYTIHHDFSIDFLLNRNIESPYVDIVQKYGSHIYSLPFDTSKPCKCNYNYIKRIVTNKYDIFHVNLSGLNALEGLRAAKKAGIDIRIYHAHNPRETSSCKAKMRSAVYETASVWIANRYVACSTLAGDSLFGNKPYTVLKNAMNTDKYIFDEAARRKLRQELNIDGKYVVGVVARLAEQKNPYFIIDIFTEICKKKSNAMLIWVGDGELKQRLLNYVLDKGVVGKVMFLGTRDDVNKLYSAMDVFLLPSKFEGLGMVFVEAQIAGLECFGSSQVPVDVVKTEKMHRIDINRPAADWALEILKYPKNQNQRYLRIKTGFEREDMMDDLANLYLS